MFDALSFDVLARYVWIIPALPLASFLVVGLVIRPYAPKLSGWIGSALLFGAFGFSVLLAYRYFAQPYEARMFPVVAASFQWLHFQKGLDVYFGALIDSISVMMLVVVTGVSSLVHLYSIGYTDHEPSVGRFFAFLGLFTFSMLGLVLAPNLFQTYVFWELVGVSSFLLIGFYFQKPSAVAASKKAFIVTRFADLGFLLGILILGFYGRSETIPNSLDYAALNGAQLAGQLGLPLLTAALLLVFMGAAGKSAMFPLHIWLPDAMEGPTPVSALIHAATMVVAGVYLVARLIPAFLAAPVALTVVAYVGLFTSIFAAVIACTQDDFKRVLAFSTLSQLGYLMFALGVSTPENTLGFTASMFHLFTHAFFKALLFLGAGSVIHAVHTNHIWEMGGLRRKMPVTHATFAIAVLAIAGIWPLSGFYSKDEILAAALHSPLPGFFAGGLLVALFTAFYMTRLYVLAFRGEPRSDHAKHAHESGVLMLIPLVILALLSIGAGWIPFGEYVQAPLAQHELGGHTAPHTGAHSGIQLAVAVPASLMAILGIALAWVVFGAGASRPEAIRQRMGFIYIAAKRKFYIDEVYLFITRKIIFRLVAAPIAWFDRHVVDGAVNLVGWSSRRTSDLMALAQTGQIQSYGLWFVFGALAVGYFFLRSR